ncbi:cold shock-induced protein TIR1-like [Dioscorea cayenensis subsp. rotundata]|uniref:Cold shock-induced protein TIR1-like n=1 Tax=Dioscorea cayennensis subsp. rotundata TaxID=55577 RepID=A0AB40ARE7_DIOCR|nr:cold shock-induced protein TIR1-like [Dioscorea cayenensis subsp. rotundata]
MNYVSVGAQLRRNRWSRAPVSVALPPAWAAAGDPRGRSVRGRASARVAPTGRVPWPDPAPQRLAQRAATGRPQRHGPTSAPGGPAAAACRASSGGYALVESSSEDDEEPAEATEAPSAAEPRITEAAPIASTDPESSTSRVHERLARLEAAVATILENQVRILERLDRDSARLSARSL